jgi:hypothetical protein
LYPTHTRKSPDKTYLTFDLYLNGLCLLGLRQRNRQHAVFKLGYNLVRLNIGRQGQITPEAAIRAFDVKVAFFLLLVFFFLLAAYSQDCYNNLYSAAKWFDRLTILSEVEGLTLLI